MVVQNGSGAKDTYGPFSSANSPILVAAPNPLSSNMDSRSDFQPKQPPLHHQMSTHQCHKRPQEHLYVGSNTMLKLHHYQVTILLRPLVHRLRFHCLKIRLSIRQS